MEGVPVDTTHTHTQKSVEEGPMIVSISKATHARRPLGASTIPTLLLVPPNNHRTATIGFADDCFGASIIHTAQRERERERERQKDKSLSLSLSLKGPLYKTIGECAAARNDDELFMTQHDEYSIDVSDNQRLDGAYYSIEARDTLVSKKDVEFEGVPCSLCIHAKLTRHSCSSARQPLERCVIFGAILYELLENKERKSYVQAREHSKALQGAFSLLRASAATATSAAAYALELRQQQFKNLENTVVVASPRNLLPFYRRERVALTNSSSSSALYIQGTERRNFNARPCPASVSVTQLKLKYFCVKLCKKMDSYNVLFNKSINQQKLETLWKLRGNINWNIEDERVEFFRQLDLLIKGWDGPLPDLGDIFEWRGEVEYLLSDCIKIMRDNYYQAKRFIDFVIATGYKDEPLVDKDGKPRLRRTTPVHLAARRWFVNRDQIIRELFKIYQANYIDECGQTHFHVACGYGFDDIVEKFLNLGQDPNCVTEKTGDSPLHLALPYFNESLVQLLLRRGAYPNLANAQGLTPLHILCARDDVDIDLLETFFEICDDEHQTLQVNAQDKLGNTPLCTTLKSKNEKVAEFLLRRGSDPNLADESGSTALHIICKSNRFFHNEQLLSKMFFKIIDENQQAVHIDAKDNLGRTPLQWAVANVMPHAVDVLLKRGADLSNFTFPTTNYFAKRYDCSYDVSFYGRFIYTSKTLAIVERLEDAGFELDQDVAPRIAKFFAKHKMFQKKDLEKSWLDHEKFASRAKKITIKKNLSLYELIQLEPEEAVKLVTPQDYAKLATSRKCVNISEQYREVCDENLCEKVARGFFRRLALYPFWEKVIWNNRTRKYLPHWQSKKKKIKTIDRPRARATGSKKRSRSRNIATRLELFSENRASTAIKNLNQAKPSQVCIRLVETWAPALPSLYVQY
ncbi:unnamed protein product [Trichogramma brassicae]|uniref:Uncharacterized protein n=1 Tax=Trichogramma brassicae TaxID=86971 RepID=A0A6H5IZ64_9HYME|nr:unnamed protein product [Trichogramma brassicae]